MAGVSYNTLARLAEQNKWHGPLALVRAIMSTRLVSNNSAYSPMYGLNTNDIDFNVGMRNPYEITPPQVIRIMPISHDLQLARRKSFHRCVPLVHAAMWIHLALKMSTGTVFNARRWSFTHFNICAKLCTNMPWNTWKRLVQKKKKIIEQKWVIFFLPTVNA